jgi:hypothetical protein
LLISIPLVQNLLFIRDKNNIEKQVENNLSIILNEKIDKFKISEIKIKELSKEKVKIYAIIQITE